MHEALLESRPPRHQIAADFEASELAGGFCVLYSSACPGRATANEDCAAIIRCGERTAVLAVADGVGGMRGGDLASRAALTALKEAILHSSNKKSESLRSSILNGIDAANKTVLDLGVGAASTLAIVEIQGHTIRPYHVGDSMILNVGQRGKIKLQTISHSPVGFAVEAGLLDPKAAMYHAQRHIVSNVIGSADMRIEIGSTLTLSPRDTLVLASDGLSDNLHQSEIIESIRKGPLETGVRQMAEKSRRRMISTTPGVPSKPDDLTIIAYRPTKPPKEKSPARRKPRRASGAA